MGARIKAKEGLRRIAAPVLAALVLAALVLAALLGAVAAGAPAAAESSSRPAAEPPPGQSAEREVIVVLREDQVSDVAATAREMAGRYGLGVGLLYRHALEGFSASAPEERLEELRADRRVRFVSVDRRGGGPGALAQQKGAFAEQGAPAAQKVPAGARRIGADRSSARVGDGRGRVDADIAVMDSGIDLQNRQLNVKGGKDCLGTGIIDDAQGHGTSVARVAAAYDDDRGTVGVAPGARLWAVKAVGEFPSYAQVVCGVDWVTARADTIEVANASFSLPGTDDGACGTRNEDALHYAICNSVEKGVTYVAAASNNRQDLAKDVPAAYDEVLTVTAMADYDGRPGGKGRPPTGCEPLGGEPLARDDSAETSISNYAVPSGADARHTLAAPGSCYPLIYRPGPGWDVVLGSGTSFAAPNAAGAAALYASRHPGAAPAEVRAALLRAAKGRPASYGYEGDPRSPIAGRHYGYLLYAGGF